MPEIAEREGKETSVMLWHLPVGHWTAVVPWRWSRWVRFAGVGCEEGGLHFGVNVIASHFCCGLDRGQPCASG